MSGPTYVDQHTGLNNIDAILLDSRAGRLEYDEEEE